MQARQIRHSGTHFVIPNLAGVLALPALVLPDEHTVAPITAPVEMPAAQVERGDIPIRLLPRKSVAARTEPKCAQYRRVPVFVNEFQPAPGARSVRCRAMPP